MQILNIVFMISIATACFSWILPQAFQLRALGLVTAAFLAFYSPLSLGILLGAACLNYFLLHKSKLTFGYNILIAILIQVFLLFYFKIKGVFAITSNAIIIPLGLSYYTFRQIHYAFEVFKRKVPLHTFEEYLVYLFFIPTLIVGPIHRFQDFLRDFRRRRWDSMNASNGLQRCLYGYAKIIIIGNYFLSGRLPIFISGLRETKPWLANYLEMLRVPLNAYFQFAGFSDVAIGLSLLMGFRVMENFNNPFWSENVVQFWQKYHMSLSSWCRDYVFTPLMSITRKAYLSIFLSMFVLSMWHEITLGYFLWGAVQAGGIIVSGRLSYIPNLIPKESKWYFIEKTPKALLVFHFFAASFLLFDIEFSNRWITEILQHIKI